MGNDERTNPPADAVSEESVPLDTIPLHSTNLLTVVDADGIIQYESPSIERLYGYDQDALVGEQVAEYFHPDDRKAVRDAFQTVVSRSDDTVESVEYRHEQADGTYRWVESTASSDPTPEGHYVVNTRDISDRKERERELERTNERLDAFASVVSHDLRNPLNVAMLHLDLAMEDCDSDHLTDVVQAHERMQTLIEDLLTVSRDGNLVTETDRVELASLSNGCWQTVSTGTASLAIEIDRKLEADRSRLRQLLENLMRNAVEHGGEDVTVTIGALEEREGFYVADDGPGVDEANRERVFESGYSTNRDGTGFGLAIVSDIADAHGWEISMTESSTGGVRIELAGVEFN
ncbi:PAS domain-containing sensor histidine kinase [Salinibaculum salinum]|uniref:sensor histidine kinase n=1 Tax=Salinibaculum salinum TaxID=3131996 RepID=UPI0030EC7FBF